MLRRTPRALVPGLALACVAALAGCGSTGSTSTGAAAHHTTPMASHPAGPRHHKHHAHGTAHRRHRHPGSAASLGSPTSTPHSAPPATEFHPPGDIPDTTVYVPYTVPGSNVQVKVPEGWGRSASNGVTTFSDHYNSVAIQVVAAKSPPSVASAKHTTVPQLARTVSNFGQPRVTAVHLAGGPAVYLTYQQDSKPDPVTTKVVRDAVERFELYQHGQEAIVTLTGPVNADNVDPWRIVSNSVRIK